MGNDLSFLHWSTRDLQRGERADKSDRKYKALRGILNEDEIDVLRKGLRITQDLRLGTSLELGESESAEKGKTHFSLFKESLSMLRENSIELNQGKIPPAWSRFQSVLEGLAERFDIVGASQNMFLTKNAGYVISKSSTTLKKSTKTKIKLIQRQIFIPIRSVSWKQVIRSCFNQDRTVLFVWSSTSLRDEDGS